MDQEGFQSLVERMEAMSRDRPAAYRRRVLALAWLGYGYLALVVTVLLALTVLAAASVVYAKALGAKIALVFGALLWVVLRSLWVRLGEPEGEAVTRADAPELFALLDRLRQRLDTPPVHRVLVTPEFNAAVTQVPRLGLFGWHRNFLILGLPLMKALTPEQFEAVLAHELGHLSRGHARLGNWIYRLRLIWGRLAQALEAKQQFGSGLIRRFYEWYVPYFQASSFPLARANEYEADATSARLTSARSAAQALTNVEVIGSFLDERYWPGIHRAARETPAPGFSPYAGLEPAAVVAPEAPDARRWLDAALARRTSHADTHPSLVDRLAGIGAGAELALPVAGAAADRLLGARRAALEARFDEAWRERIGPSWAQHYERTQADRARLAELRGQGEAGAQEPEVLLERAALEEAVAEDAATALALRREAVGRAPDSLLARFALGRQLLQQDDPEGVALIEGVIAADVDALASGAELLRDFHWRRGDEAQARAWHQRHVERVTWLRQQDEERSTIRLKDKFAAHDLDPEVVAGIVAALGKVPHVFRARMVRRLARGPHDEAVYVLAYKVTRAWQWHREARAQEAEAAIQAMVPLPAGTLIISVDGDNYRFGRKFAWMRGTRIL